MRTLYTRDGRLLDTRACVMQAAAARREVIAALGSDAGYDGYLVPLDQYCPHCQAWGYKTNGGQPTRLCVRIADGVADEAIVCPIHGEVA